jgi:hypothetical protein
MCLHLGFDDTVEYIADVLEPDEVTVGIAHIAAREINRRPVGDRLVVYEPFMGAAPYLSVVRQNVSCLQPLTLAGADTDKKVLDIATYNVTAAINMNGSPADSMLLSNESWESLIDGGNADSIYVNPNYLKVGQKVRESFRTTPRSAMYVPPDKSPIYYYERVLPELAGVLNPDGFCFIRTPREQTWHCAIGRLLKELLGDTHTIHRVVVRDEFGARCGGGFAVQAALAESAVYSVQPVREIGLAVQKTH